MTPEQIERILREARLQLAIATDKCAINNLPCPEIKRAIDALNRISDQLQKL